MARKALLVALSGKVKDDELLVLDQLNIDAPKTKEIAKIMANFPQVKNGLLVAEKDEKIKRAGRNFSGLKIANLDNLNILDILKYKHLLITEKGIEFLNKKYEAAH